ncbi:serpin family protein [Rubripirellula reticaptiva]|uniref:Serpin (Serine protease inhibitor) n=1 Tax=Rubripirellula reticaptiva TaxID=2528013 RepID=A0A5C6ENV0_9BACT|nr:serpin family protein [Rubripirellula reticaptiva]TWU49276.1 Serpin (serine protease inhibitor) [Rubripirellula reticaptiva]
MNDKTGEITSDVQQVVQANNQFAVDLYSKLATAVNGDLFFSPSSISLALAMTYAGARGDTAKEIAEAMHFSLPSDRLHQSLRKLQQETKTGGVEFRIANRLWGQRDYHFLSEFLQITERKYGACLAEADFVHAAEAMRIEINDWVAEQTAQRITNLVPPDSFNELTRLVLANAIYFLGSWENEFKEQATVDANFNVTPGQTHPTRMMRQSGFFQYGEFDDLQVLEMPYKSHMIEWKTVKHGDIEGQEPVEVPDGGSDFAMTIFLPRKVDGVAHIEKHLTTKIQEWMMLQPSRVSIQLPKFGMESTHFLNETLQSLGMKKPFIVDKADFSGMSDNPEGLFIGSVIHKAFVKVNEKGTEAAAATAIVMRGGSAREPEPPKEFIADHPFIFLIRDRRTQQIHFMGRVCAPTFQD